MKALLFAILSASGFAAHAGGVQVDMIPLSPVVFTADYVYHNGAGEPVTVEAPWFSFKLHVFNQATDPLMVGGLRVEVSGTDKDGQPFTQITDFHPVDYGSDKCIYEDFGQFDPKGTAGGPVLNDKNLFLTPAKGSAADCLSGEIMFYVGKNPELQANKDGSQNFKYHVRVRPLGWFESAGSPKSRFDQFTDADTQ